MSPSSDDDLPHAGSYGFPLVEQPARSRPSAWRVVGAILLMMPAVLVVYTVVALLAGAIAGEVCAIATELVVLVVVLRLTGTRSRPTP